MGAASPACAVEGVAEVPGKDHRLWRRRLQWSTVATAIAAAIERTVRVEATRSERLEIDSRLRRPDELVPARKVVESLYRARKAEPRVSISITSRRSRRGDGPGLVRGHHAGDRGRDQRPRGVGYGREGPPRGRSGRGDAHPRQPLGNRHDDLDHGRRDPVQGGARSRAGWELPAPFTLLVDSFSGRRRNTGSADPRGLPG